MSLKYPNDFFRTAAFQLTLFYFVIFSLVMSVGTSLMYLSVRHHLFDEIDILLNQIRDKMMYYIDRSSLETLNDEFRREAEARGADVVFVRLLSGDGDVIAGSDVSAWPDLSSLTVANVHPLVGSKYETRRLTNQSESVRVLSAPTTDSRVFQTGVVLRDQSRFLRSLYRDAAFITLFAMPVAALLGYGAARYALKGVEAVSLTAERIAKGELHRRVDCSLHGEEIARLGRTFNHMADRIQGVMAEMKEVNDLIAHDLRSPLTRIRMAAESLISNRGLIDEPEEIAGSIIESCDGLLRMINTMLDISETNAGIRVIQRKPVDITTLLRTAVNLYTPLVEEQRMELSVSVAESLFVNGDEGKLQRAVANLIDNAIKFSYPSGRIEIQAAAMEPGVRITVRDEGIGIPPEEHPKIFERFYRCDRSRHQPGNGLGLCFAKTVIEAHGGQIAVESAPGKGSCFTIILPPIMRNREL